MLYCFDSLLQLFHVGTFGLGGGRRVFGRVHPDALLVPLLPNLSLVTREEADDDTLQWINTGHTGNDSIVTDSLWHLWKVSLFIAVLST